MPESHEEPSVLSTPCHRPFFSRPGPGILTRPWFSSRCQPNDTQELQQRHGQWELRVQFWEAQAQPPTALRRLTGDPQPSLPHRAAGVVAVGVVVIKLMNHLPCERALGD
ncbi:UNVERIFIED_CONTAM: hypothetical protein K2H54_047315 [Gekko kuhli]